LADKKLVDQDKSDRTQDRTGNGAPAAQDGYQNQVCRDKDNISTKNLHFYQFAGIGPSFFISGLRHVILNIAERSEESAQNSFASIQLRDFSLLACLSLSKDSK
jgi:hypothetical protein